MKTLAMDGQQGISRYMHYVFAAAPFPTVRFGPISPKIFNTSITCHYVIARIHPSLREARGFTGAIHIWQDISKLPIAKPCK